MNDPTIRPHVRPSYKAVIVYENGQTENVLAHSLDAIVSVAEYYSAIYQSEIHLVKIIKLCASPQSESKTHTTALSR